MLPPGIYKTEAGSTMQISGKYGGISSVDLDWLEEENACCECVPDPYDDKGFLTWCCEHCDGGQAKLEAM